MLAPIAAAFAMFLAILRVSGVRDETFQAFAHIYVGVLLLAVILSIRFKRADWPSWAGILGFLTIVETLCFFLLPR